MVAARFSAAFVVLIFLLTSCSSVKEELKPVPLKAISAKLKLQKQWHRDTGKGQDARYQRLQPAYLNGFIYTVDINGDLGAFDAATGKPKWRAKLHKEIGGGVGVYGNYGFVGTLDGHVIAFDLADGRERWQAAVSSEVLSSPQANGDVVIAVAIDGRIFAFDLETGKQRWNYDHPTPILSLRSTASPLVQENSVFVAFDNGQLLSFNPATGQLQWNARVGQPEGKTELDRLVDADSNPIEYGPYIYGAGYNGRLVAMSKGSGRIAWGQSVSTAQNIVASDNMVVVVDTDSHIKAFDATNGNMLWENDQLHRRGASAPGVLGSVVLVVDTTGYIHGLSLLDGSIIARSRLGEVGALAQPFAVGDTVYFYDINGKLSARSLEPTTSSGSIWDLPTNRAKGAIATKNTGVN